jgi:hypothetical protein
MENNMAFTKAPSGNALHILPASQASYASPATAIATTDDTAVVVNLGAVAQASNLRVVNEGSVVGWVSVDTGDTWHRLPTGVSLFQSLPPWSGTGNVMVKRVASGSNLAGIFVSAW